MNEELTERVERGAEWLDTVYPEWWTHVDLDELEMENACRCVLGQVFATNAFGFYVVQDLRTAAGLTSEWDRTHGFDFSFDDIAPGGGFSAGHKVYAALDELWIDAIRARWSAGVL